MAAAASVPWISRLRRLIGHGLLGVATAFALGWGAAALWFDSSAPRVLMVAFLGISLSLPFLLRPWYRAGGAFLALFGALLVWWLTIPASNERPWQLDVARPPTAEIHGNRLVVHGVTIGADGAVATGGRSAVMEVQLEGLAPGPHTFVGYHHAPGGAGTYTVSAGDRKVEGIEPSRETRHNDEV